MLRRCMRLQGLDNALAKRGIAGALGDRIRICDGFARRYCIASVRPLDRQITSFSSAGSEVAPGSAGSAVVVVGLLEDTGVQWRPLADRANA